MMLGAAIRRIKHLKGEEEYNLNHSPNDKKPLIKLKHSLKEKHVSSTRVGKYTDRDYYDMYKKLEELLEQNLSAKETAQKFLNSTLPHRKGVTFKQRMMISDLKWPRSKNCKSKHCKQQIKATELLRRDFMTVYDTAISKNQQGSVPLPQISRIPTIISLIGPISAYQVTIEINDQKRYITLLGNESGDLTSCLEPSHQTMHFYNTINNELNNKNFDAAKDLIKTYIDTLKISNVMPIYDYILYLISKGNTCIDVFDEMPIESHNKAREIKDYQDIFNMFFRLCGKKNNTAICNELYPAVRYHQTSFDPIDIAPKKQINQNYEAFKKIISEYIDAIINDKKFKFSDHLLSENKSNNKDTHVQKILELTRKQYKKSIFVGNSTFPRIIHETIKYIYKNSEYDIIHSFIVLQTSLYQLFRLFVGKWTKKEGRLSEHCKNQSEYPKYSVVYCDELHKQFLHEVIKRYFKDYEYHISDADARECCKRKYENPLSKCVQIKVAD